LSKHLAAQVLPYWKVSSAARAEALTDTQHLEILRRVQVSIARSRRLLDAQELRKAGGPKSPAADGAGGSGRHSRKA
jgi:hypothetical protein